MKKSKKIGKGMDTGNMGVMSRESLTTEVVKTPPVVTRCKGGAKKTRGRVNKK